MSLIARTCFDQYYFKHIEYYDKLRPKMGLPEDWEINRNEDEIEIRWIDMLTEKELEQQVEADIT